MLERSRLVGGLLAAGVLMCTASARSAEGEHFLWRQCNEDAMGISVEPGGLQEWVGSRFTVAVEQGKARLGLLFQDCSEYWIDGRSYGPTRDLHVLVQLEGSPEVRPVVGAPQTRPTMRWFQLFAGSDNADVRDAWKASGRLIRPIASLSVDPPGPHRRGFALVDETLSLSWQVTSAPPSGPLVGVNHEIHAREQDGGLVLVRVEALASVSAGLSEGVLDVAGKPSERFWILPGRYPAAVFSPQPMRARATIRRVP